jgi:CheY-like chemotaxis protein/DNA-binding XRE family transcriptional regulator
MEIFATVDDRKLSKAVGKAIRYCRDKSGITQEMLSEKANIDRSYLSQVERGVKNATIVCLSKISLALETPISTVLNYAEQLLEDGSMSKSIDFASLREAVDPADQEAGVVLIADDSPDVCYSVETVLQLKGFKTKSAFSGMEAMSYVGSHRLLAIVSDIMMGPGGGLDLLQVLKSLKRDIPVFFITGLSDISEADLATKGASGVFKKPLDFDLLVETLNKLNPIPNTKKQ